MRRKDSVGDAVMGEGKYEGQKEGFRGYKLKNCLKEYLEDNGIKHSWLSRKVGIHQVSLTRIINGDRTPTLPVAFLIAQTLKQPLEKLFWLEKSEDNKIDPFD